MICWSSMRDDLLVLLGDDLAGTLTRLRGGRVRFVYDEGYRARIDPTPLSVSTPIAIPVHDWIPVHDDSVTSPS